MASGISALDESLLHAGSPDAVDLALGDLQRVDIAWLRAWPSTLDG